MSRSTSLYGLAAGLCLIAATACGSSSIGSSSGSSSVTAPTAPTLNLAGSWSGTFTSPQGDGQPDDNPGLVTWMASQSGSSLTGPITLTFTEHGETQTFRGTMSGTLSGSELSLTLAFPAGIFADVPACAITGTGTATPTGTTISSTLTITFGAACIGTVSERSSETDYLSLTKQ